LVIAALLIHTMITNRAAPVAAQPITVQIQNPKPCGVTT
jgi:hypothetical protein